LIDRIFESKISKNKIQIGPLLLALGPLSLIIGHHFGCNKVWINISLGKGEELISKPTLFQMF